MSGPSKKIKIYFNAVLILVGMKARELWLWLKPGVLPYWGGFKFAIEKIFAFSDRSALRGARIVLRLAVMLVVTLVFWGALFHIDQVINAQGQIIADSKTQVIQAADGGVLIDMRVKEGDVVERGETVAVLEKDRAQAAFAESYSRVTALRMTIARLRAEIDDRELVYDESLKGEFSDLIATQISLYKKRRQSHLEKIKSLRDNVHLAEQELKLNLPLEKFGDVSKTDILKLKRAVNDAKGGLMEQNNKYFQDASADLNKAQEDLNAQEQTLAERKMLLEHTNILSPAAGIVKSVRVTTIGGVLRQGDEILQILPTESDLVIEAKIKPEDIAFIDVGLPVKVKLDAYDYAIFGSMNGRLSYVSADTLTEDGKSGPVTYYRVKIRISEKELQGKGADNIKIRPGMTATIDIKTGNRSILSYILKPIVKTLGSSLGEK